MHVILPFGTNKLELFISYAFQRKITNTANLFTCVLYLTYSFCHWTQQKWNRNNCPKFIAQLFFTDELTFYLQVIVNKVLVKWKFFSVDGSIYVVFTEDHLFGQELLRITIFLGCNPNRWQPLSIFKMEVNSILMNISILFQ